jgi:predicted SAM-dependent methyltransferase
LTTIRDYLASQERNRTKPVQRGAVARVARGVLPWEVRQRGKLVATQALSPRERRRAERLAAAGGLRLHLGSGNHHLPGWVNVDVFGNPCEILWDLRSPLPFPDGSVDAAFLEHVLEHFDLASGLTLLEGVHRVLRPGGILRVGVPDLGRYMQSYAGDGTLIEELRPGRPTPLLAVAEVTQAHGHRSAWDADTLVTVLREAGFDDIRACAPGESALDPVPDSESRAGESIYAEGRRPGQS